MAKKNLLISKEASNDRDMTPKFYYPILEKEGEFSTIEHEEFLKSFNEKTKIWDISFINSLKEKYKREKFNIFYPDDKDLGALWKFSITDFRANTQHIEINKKGLLCYDVKNFKSEE